MMRGVGVSPEADALLLSWPMVEEHAWHKVRTRVQPDSLTQRSGDPEKGCISGKTQSDGQLSQASVTSQLTSGTSEQQRVLKN